MGILCWNVLVVIAWMAATVQAATEDQGSFTLSNLLSGLEVPGHCFTALAICKLICTECNNCYEDYIKCGFDAKKSLWDIPLAGPFLPLELLKPLDPLELPSLPAWLPVDTVDPQPVQVDPVITTAINPITPWHIYPWPADPLLVDAKPLLNAFLNPEPIEKLVQLPAHESNVEPRPTGLPAETLQSHPSHEATAHAIKHLIINPRPDDSLPVSAEPLLNLPLTPDPNEEPETETPAEHESYLEVQSTSLPGHHSHETTTVHPKKPLLTDPLPTSPLPVSTNPPLNLPLKLESTDEPEPLTEQELSEDPWPTSLPPVSPGHPSSESP